MLADLRCRPWRRSQAATRGSGEEREQPPDLGFVRLAAVFADLERLGIFDRRGPLLPVARSQPGAEAVRRRGKTLAEGVPYLLLAGRLAGGVLRQAARRHVAASPFVELRLHRLDHGQLLLDHVVRSEEHTSELQSPTNLVCRLLLE